MTASVIPKHHASLRLAPLLLSSLLIGAQADTPPAPDAAADQSATAAQQPCDLALGKRVFGQCSICHSVEKDVAPTAGPNLYGILGRTAASAPGFSYSKALRDSGKTWTAQELEHFLEQPMSAIPGTTMAFAGLKKSAERTAVVCYLSQNK